MLRATMNTIRKYWENCDAETRGKNESSLIYIRDLAGKTNTTISRWNIVSVFGNGSGADLVHDVNELNKLFFAHMAKAAPDPAEEAEAQAQELPQIDPAIRVCLERSAKSSLHGEVEALRQNVQYAKNELRRYYQQHNQRVRDIANSEARLAVLTADVSHVARAAKVAAKVEADLVAVLQAGFWCDLMLDREGTIWLTTASPITLSQFAREAGIEVSANIGYFAVGINILQNTIKVVPYKGNKRASDGFFHPHVDEEGNICWGDASEIADKHRIAWAIKDLLFIMQELLCSYNPGNPYRELKEFVSARAYGRIASDLRSPQSDRDIEASLRSKLEQDCDTAAKNAKVYVGTDIATQQLAAAPVRVGIISWDNR